MPVIVCVIGTRPEAIKMIPVIKALSALSVFTIKVLVSGQHQSLLTPFLSADNIKIDAQFSVMEENQRLGKLNSKLLTQFDAYFARVKPNLVIGQGDTTTTLSAAMSAFYQQIPFAHVEAGLRTSTIHSPFPEEFNRRTISLISEYHFCPTASSAINLNKEGIKANIYVTGNTVIDYLKQMMPKVTPYPTLRKKLILITFHRRENLGKNLLDIVAAIKALSTAYPDIDFLLPIHPNPLISPVVKKHLSHLNNVQLSAPLAYPSMLSALKSSFLVLTDSGGIQEEAPALQKPVLVLRDETERQEGIDVGAAKLIGTKTANIVHEVEMLIGDRKRYEAMSEAGCPYGDGQAATKIATIIKTFLIKESYVA
jgi:UDP-N-acetylglucosamine 2-epimerase (non-hydrolysing)